MKDQVNIKKIIVWAAISLFTIIAISFGGCAGYKSYARAQKLADARNKVKITEIQIRTAHQQVAVQQQLAKVKIAEAYGIRRSQEIINATLTDRYLQHEAIKAQLQMSKSSNHTQVYIPTGANGIPLVNNVQGPSR